MSIARVYRPVVARDIEPPCGPLDGLLSLDCVPVQYIRNLNWNREICKDGLCAVVAGRSRHLSARVRARPAHIETLDLTPVRLPTQLIGSGVYVMYVPMSILNILMAFALRIHIAADQSPLNAWHLDRSSCCPAGPILWPRSRRAPKGRSRKADSSSLSLFDCVLTLEQEQERGRSRSAGDARPHGRWGTD